MPIGNPIGRTNNVASRIITVEATSAQTLFTVQGGYRVNAISVYRNGVRLANDNDYTASDGSTVLLNLAANTGDTLTFHIFDDFKVADAIVSAASTQTVYGNLAVTGSIYANNFNEGVGEFVHDSNDNVYTQSLTTLTDLSTGSDNFVVGAGASEITTGSDNNFIGNDAGRCTTTGAYNNFFGANAGLANTSGTSNNFLGLNAGRKNSVGSNNTFLGQDAGCCNTSGRNNVFLGASAGRSNTTGSNNFFVGNSAGLENTTGCNNVSIGQSAGKSTTTGCGNVFLGMEAGCLNTTGEFNNFLGFKAGIGNTTGKRNNFLGVNAGRCNTSGSYNNFFGGNAGLTNSTGNSNTFIGRSAGCSNTTGGCNTFIGENSGRVNTTGNSNNFLGLNAGFSNTTGANNIFVGSCAGYSNTSGDANVFLGGNAGKCNSTGKWNFAVSSFALNNNVSGCYNVAIGRRAGVGYTGSNGIFIGAEAGRCSADGEHNIHLGFYAGCCTTGCHNNFLGEQAGRNSTTGAYNNFFGRYTGCSNTTGGHNTFMGRKAGCSNTTGGCNTFIGENAGRFNQTGSLNTFIGRNAGCCATGSYNHFFGNAAGQMTTTGEKNVFIGPLAAQFNTTGCNNIFLGHCAGRCNTIGSFNNFSGQAAGCNNISGCYNNFFGNQAGFANTTGSNNNFLGRIAGCSITTGSNNFIVGNIAGTSALSDTIILGTNTTERLRIDSSGRVGIGTINPQEDLHIGSNSPYILLEDYDNSRKWRIKGTAFFAIEDNTAGEDRLLIDSSGQVGIGTNSPDSLLHLSTTSAEIVQTFETSTGTVKLYANNDDFVFDADKYRFRSEDGLTEYVRIDSDGRLGVGTISMSALIHARTASAGANMFMLEADLGTNNDRTFYITAPATDSGSDPFTFKTGNSIDFEVDSVSRLRIDSSGRVGIGTDNPTTNLVVSGSGSNSEIYINRTDAAVSGLLNINSGNNTNNIYSTGVKDLTFATNNTERARITGSGYFGIGTEDPDTMLNVKDLSTFTLNTNTIDYTVFLEGGDTSGQDNYGASIGFSRINGGTRTGAVIATKQTSTDADQQGISFLTHSSSNTNADLNESMLITHDGKIGIGVTDPSEKLFVNGNIGLTGSAPTKIYTNSNSLYLGSDEDNNNSSSTITFNIDADEKARIDSSGRLLVGTTSARSNFVGSSTPQMQVEGTSYGENIISAIRNQSSGTTGTGGEIQLARSGGVNVGSTDAVAEGNKLGVLHFSGLDGSNFVQAALIESYVDGTVGVNSMPGRLAFYTTAEGESSPTERMRIDKDGKIGFSDYPRDGNNVRFANPITGATNMDSVINIGAIQTDVTSSANGFKTYLQSPDGTRTTNEINHFAALQGTYGIGHTVTDQRGYYAHATLTGGTNNYGFYGNIASGSNRWNFYANGDAANFFNGSVLFNSNNETSIEAGTTNGKSIGSSGILYSARSAVDERDHVIFSNTNGEVGSIRTNGSATSYETSSDYRLKENVVLMTGAIDRVKALRPSRFNFIADPDKTVDGFIAHEAQEVVPEAVSGTKDATEAIGILTEYDGTVIETGVTEPSDLTWEETITDEEGVETTQTRTRTWTETGTRDVMQGIDQAKLVPLLTAALQEALTKIEALEARVATLESTD